MKNSHLGTDLTDSEDKKNKDVEAGAVQIDFENESKKLRPILLYRVLYYKIHFYFQKWKNLRIYKKGPYKRNF